MPPPKRKHSRSERRSTPQPAGANPQALVAICSGLAALVWIVFGQTLRAGFVNYDDDTYVYENPKVITGITLRGITWAFTHFHSNNWHPLTWLSHMLDCQVYGLNAGGHHFTNVFLHTAAVVLVFLVLNKMTGALWRSAFVAAVFAIHPLRVESVAWIAERKDVLSGLFFALTLSAYVNYTRTRSTGRYLLVMVLFSLGLMCKPMLVTVPLVLLLVDYWPLDRFKVAGAIRPLLLEKIPLSALALSSGVVTLFAQRSTTISVEQLPLLWRAGNAVVTCVTYILQMLWPVRLIPLYVHPENQLATWQIALSIVVVASISLVALFLRQARPYLFVGWFWYLGMLLPVIGIVQVGIQAHADRYTYLPQIGLYVLASWGVYDLITGWRYRLQIASVAATIIIVSLVWLSSIQAGYWHDSEDLWNHTLSLSPNSAYAHNNLGVALTRSGKIDEAIDHLRTTVQLLPDHPTVHYNLGNVLMEKGQPDAAISEFQRQLALQPDHVATHSNLATALLQKGNVNEAMAEYEKTIELQPDFALARYNLGNCYFQKGNVKKAIEQYETSLTLDPQLTAARNNLAVAFSQNGQLDQAISQWDQVIVSQPDDVGALNNFTWFLATSPNASIRDSAKALRLAQRLRELSGHANPGILRTVAAAYAENGRFQEAIEIAEQGLQLASLQRDESLSEDLEADVALYKTNTALRISSTP